MKIICSLSALALSTSTFHVSAQSMYRPSPAGSYSVARAVDNLIRPVAPDISNFITNQVLPSGSYCGRVALYTDTRSITERAPCPRYSVLGPVTSTVYVPPTDAYCSGGDNPICYEARPGYYTTVTPLGANCPGGYGLTVTGSSGPYQYYACIKS